MSPLPCLLLAGLLPPADGDPLPLTSEAKASGRGSGSRLGFGPIA